MVQTCNRECSEKLNHKQLRKIAYILQFTEEVPYDIYVESIYK